MIEVKRRGQDQLLDLGAEAGARAEVIERTPDSERRRCENRGTPLPIDAVPQQRADVDRRGAQEQVLGARDLAEPVDAVCIWSQDGFFEHAERPIEPAADHLQLADTLVGLLATQPLAHARDSPPQRGVERRQRRDRVFGLFTNVGPALVLAKCGRDSDRLLPPLGFAESRRDPDVGDAKQLAHAHGGRDGLRRGFAERVVGCAQPRLELQLLQQSFCASATVHPVAGKPLEERQQAGSVDLLSQAPRRRFFEVMGFIDDQVVVLRQQSAANLRVGKQQRMVDHDQVSGLGLGASPMHVAVLFRAVDADAVERVARDARPQHLLASVQAQLRAVPTLRGVQPHEDFQLEHQLFRVLARLRQIAAPAPQRDVVRAPLEEAGLEVPGQPFAQARQVFDHELLLQRVRVGRNHDALAVTHGASDRRDESDRAHEHDRDRVPPRDWIWATASSICSWGSRCS